MRIDEVLFKSMYQDGLQFMERLDIFDDIYQGQRDALHFLTNRDAEIRFREIKIRRQINEQYVSQANQQSTPPV